MRNSKKVTRVLAAMAGLTLSITMLAGCGQQNSPKTNASSTPKTNQGTTTSPAKVTNTPTTLAEFKATIKAAGYELVDVKVDNSGFHKGRVATANVKVDGHKGTIVYDLDSPEGGFAIEFDDLGISHQTSAIYGSDSSDANYIRSKE